MKIRNCLTRRMLLVAAIIACATTIVYAQEQPTLSARCDTVDFIRNLPKNASPALREFQGLFIEENAISELYPFATSIFFDAGSAELSDRHVLFIEPSQTVGFDETKIPGGTLQKYYQALNIIGSRLRNHPDKAISIVGCNSYERKTGETRQLSTQRANSVRDYLINIWGIDPARIKMLPPRDLPKRPSNPDDPDGAVENRRVEIISNDWEIARVVSNTELRRYPQPELMKFEMSNSVADSLVVRREIVITRGGKPWHLMLDIGLTDKLSPEYNWGMNGNEDSIPQDQQPYVAQLIVYTADRQELVSNKVEVPVKIYTHKGRGEHWRNIDRFSLTLFSYDNARLDDISQRALREYVYPEIREVSNVYMTGHTDNIGSEDHNLDLSQQRAAAVLGDMQKEVKVIQKGMIASLEAKGAGETAPLYSNDLPEGRFYNRTVQVIVENPKEDGW